jgi:hypothetical protein
MIFYVKGFLEKHQTHKQQEPFYSTYLKLPFIPEKHLLHL